jgi:hypothetical protein
MHRVVLRLAALKVVWIGIAKALRHYPRGTRTGRAAGGEGEKAGNKEKAHATKLPEAGRLVSGAFAPARKSPQAGGSAISSQAASAWAAYISVGPPPI